MLALTFESVDETQVRDLSNESYCAVLSYGTVDYAVRGVSGFMWIKAYEARPNV